MSRNNRHRASCLSFDDHEWELSVTELGDFLAACPCGHQRLLTGLVVRGRTAPGRSWRTPYQWNRPFYDRSRPVE